MLVPRNSSLMPVMRGDYGLHRLFDDLFEGFPFSGGSVRSLPAVNTWEDEKSYRVEAELPGMDKNDVEISAVGRELRISGKREEKLEENAKYHRRERSFGEFHRMVRFPGDVEAGKIEARFENGVLTLTVPKAETALPRKIEIKG